MSRLTTSRDPPVSPSRRGRGAARPDAFDVEDRRRRRLERRGGALYRIARRATRRGDRLRRALSDLHGRMRRRRLPDDQRTLLVAFALGSALGAAAPRGGPGDRPRLRDQADLRHRCAGVATCCGEAGRRRPVGRLARSPPRRRSSRRALSLLRLARAADAFIADVVVALAARRDVALGPRCLRGPTALPGVGRVIVAAAALTRPARPGDAWRSARPPSGWESRRGLAAQRAVAAPMSRRSSRRRCSSRPSGERALRAEGSGAARGPGRVRRSRRLGGDAGRGLAMLEKLPRVDDLSLRQIRTASRRQAAARRPAAGRQRPPSPISSPTCDADSDLPLGAHLCDFPGPVFPARRRSRRRPRYVVFDDPIGARSANPPPTPTRSASRWRATIPWPRRVEPSFRAGSCSNGRMNGAIAVTRTALTRAAPSLCSRRGRERSVRCGLVERVRVLVWRSSRCSSPRRRRRAATRPSTGDRARGRRLRSIDDEEFDLQRRGYAAAIVSDK